MFTNDDVIVKQCEYKSDKLITLKNMSFWKLKTVLTTENTSR